MIELTYEGKKRKNLILFIHGLTGDDLTWVNNTGKSFADLLYADKEVKKKFDIAHFSYYTKIFTALPLKMGSNFLQKLFSGKSKTTKINLDIPNLSDLLVTEIGVKCNKYENVTIIAHSMGGLIAKSAILKLIAENKSENIKAFISLAVPHSGSALGIIGSTLSNNVQIQNLEPLSTVITTLNNEWIMTNNDKLPKTIYCQGKHDLIVPNTSSIGYESQKQSVLYFDSDHFTISKPESNKSTILLAVKQELLSIVTEKELTDLLELKKLENMDIFNNEYFVLKLIIADVHNKNISSAKKSFYNAEFIRKIIQAKKIIPLKDFQNLYNLIASLYDVAFGLLTAGILKNGNELVAHVHSQIQQEDQKILKSISALSFVHKTGMLHQLANDLNNDIWWSDGHNVQTMANFKQAETEK